MKLQARWYQIAQEMISLGLCPPDFAYANVFEQIIARYKEPHRFYHNESHLTFCFKELDRVQKKGSIPKILTIKITLLGHEYVYIIEAEDNEAQSAIAFGDLLAVNGVNLQLCLEVTSLIGATDPTRTILITPEEEIMSDVDKAILKSPWPVYSAYYKGIEKEYIPVYGQKKYMEGRTGFLIKMLKHGRIFFSPYYDHEDEAKARENIAHELDLLRRLQ